MKQRLKEWGQKQGIRLGDEMTFYPVQGRKKSITLNRTLYEINASSESFFELWGKEVGDIKLNWRACSQLDQKGMYHIESSTTPFLHNGHYTWKTCLGHGDEVFLGYNRIRFTRKCSELESESISVERENLYKSSINIVLEGETGVGKSHRAKAIHEMSARRGRFIHVNLSSFSTSLLESELFGHVKGAYTGAIGDKRGAIMEANGGTLFLDEIDSLPKEIQLKLLLFLDNKKVRPVGGARESVVNVRLIFASGQCLKKCVAQKIMRRDFYYRISGGHKEYLASLREVPDRITEFSQKYLMDKGYYLSEKLVGYYKTYHWPGNIRQLKAHLDKKMLLSISKKIIFDKWDSQLAADGFDGEIVDFFEHNEISLEELKQRYLLKTYYKLGSFKAAGEKLGIAEKTVRNVLSRVSSRKDEVLMVQ